MDPFFADNHAPDAPTFHPAGPDDEERVRRLIEAHYPDFDGGEAPLEVIGDVNMNSSNFRIGPAYLKVIDQPGPRDYVPHFPELTAELARHGVPVGRFLENGEGDLITAVHGTGGELTQYVYLQEYLSAGFYTGERGEFERCCELLHQLGPALSSIRPTPGQYEPYRSWHPTQILAGIEESVATEDPSGTSEGHWETQFRRVRDQMHALAVSFDATRSVSEGDGLAHSDLHPHNLLFRDGELAALLDLESFRVVPLGMAVAFGVYKLGRKSVSTGRMSIADVRRIAAGRFELDALRDPAKYEILRRLLYQFEQRFVHGNGRWASEIDKFVVGLDEIDLLLG